MSSRTLFSDHIDPLLCKDLETNNENSRCYAVGKQKAVSEQQLGKHVPSEMNIRVTIEEWGF
jgi:hypothetical protein